MARVRACLLPSHALEAAARAHPAYWLAARAADVAAARLLQAATPGARRARWSLPPPLPSRTCRAAT